MKGMTDKWIKRDREMGVFWRERAGDDSGMGHLGLLTTGWSDAVWAEDDNKRVKCQASSQTIRPLYIF